MSRVPDACRTFTLWFGSEEVRKCISEPIFVASITCVSQDFAALHLYEDNNKMKNIEDITFDGVLLCLSVHL